jgi:adenylyl-sulfate kinase
LSQEKKAKNITWQHSNVSLSQRESILEQRGCVVWLTGLSGSGKSTIASALEEKLTELGNLAFILDGDNVRHGLNVDLGFSSEDRTENIRRIGQVAALFSQTGVITIVSFISPYIVGRQIARKSVGKDRFIEVYLNVPLEECEKRDPKGLYKKARAGKITDFTGIDAPYEQPENPELVIQTYKFTPEECARHILDELLSRNIISNKYK